MKDMEKKVVEIEETEVNEVEETETKLDKIKNSKPVSFVKKHGKKIAVGAIIGAAFLIGRAIGEKDGFEYSEFKNSNDDDDVIDLDDYTVSEETTNEEK